QASSRLTWIGNAESVDPSDAKIRHRYLRYFPSAESYFENHDFSLYCIHLRSARFIGGFGEIHWFEPDVMLLKNPFHETESSIVKHMSQEYKEELFYYCKVLKVTSVNAVEMSGIESKGFDMLADNRKLSIDFDTSINSIEEAPATLVKLSRL